MSFDPSAIWPRGSTDLLLRTALHMDPETARAAWSDWRAAYDLDQAPWMDVRIAALVGARLPALGIDSDLQPVLKGITRHIWAHGQSRFAASRPLLVRWHEAGIPLLALKGFARIVAEPALAARRYIGDIDILLRAEDWARAVDIAWDAGWQAKNGWSREDLAQRMRHRRHSISLVGDTPVELDAHRFALFDNRCRDDDAGGWARATAGHYAELPFLVPSPADRAVIACGHGSVFEDDEAAQVDWLVDTAAAALAPDMDWQIFETEVQRRALAPQVLGALTYLERLDFDLPTGLVARLRDDCPAPVVTRMLRQREGRAARNTPEFRAASLAADELRAERACAARPDWRTAGDVAAPSRAGIVEPDPNGRVFRVPVPGGIGPDDAVALVLSVEPGHCDAGERIVLDVDGFEVNIVNFASWRAPLKGRLSRFMRRPRFTVTLPAPLLVAREADFLRVKLRRPGRPQNSPPERRPVMRIGYEWQVTRA